MAKIPWHFFKIPWQFPDLEKILFFPDFSLTRGNPETGAGTYCWSRFYPISLHYSNQYTKTICFLEFIELVTGIIWTLEIVSPVTDSTL